MHLSFRQISIVSYDGEVLFHRTYPTVEARCRVLSEARGLSHEPAKERAAWGAAVSRHVCRAAGHPPSNEEEREAAETGGLVRHIAGVSPVVLLEERRLGVVVTAVPATAQHGPAQPGGPEQLPPLLVSAAVDVVAQLCALCTATDLDLRRVALYVAKTLPLGTLTTRGTVTPPCSLLRAVGLASFSAAEASSTAAAAVPDAPPAAAEKKASKRSLWRGTGVSLSPKTWKKDRAGSGGGEATAAAAAATAAAAAAAASSESAASLAASGSAGASREGAFEGGVLSGLPPFVAAASSAAAEAVVVRVYHTETLTGDLTSSGSDAAPAGGGSGPVGQRNRLAVCGAFEYCSTGGLDGDVAGTLDIRGDAFAAVGRPLTDVSPQTKAAVAPGDAAAAAAAEAAPPGDTAAGWGLQLAHGVVRAEALRGVGGEGGASLHLRLSGDAETGSHAPIARYHCPSPAAAAAAAAAEAGTQRRPCVAASFTAVLSAPRADGSAAAPTVPASVTGTAAAWRPTYGAPSSQADLQPTVAAPAESVTADISLQLSIAFTPIPSAVGAASAGKVDAASLEIEVVFHFGADTTAVSHTLQASSGGLRTRAVDLHSGERPTPGKERREICWRSGPLKRGVDSFTVAGRCTLRSVGDVDWGLYEGPRDESAFVSGQRCFASVRVTATGYASHTGVSLSSCALLPSGGAMPTLQLMPPRIVSQDLRVWNSRVEDPEATRLL